MKDTARNLDVTVSITLTASHGETKESIGQWLTAHLYELHEDIVDVCILNVKEVSIEKEDS